MTKQMFGPCELGAVIGHGADSVVREAKIDGRNFAIKMPRDETKDLQKLLLRYRREAAITSQVAHPAVVKMYSVGDVGGVPYILMERVQGESVRDLIRRGALTAIEIASIGAVVAEALHSAHRWGIINGDVKPDNILIDASGNARLIDFGLAILRGNESTIVRGESVAGTLAYTAPEQTGARRAPVDGRADLYSLGITMFEMATGSLPYRADDVVELLRLHADAPIPSIEAKAPELVKLAPIILQLMQKSPTARFGNGLELGRALRAAFDVNADDISHRSTQSVGRKKQLQDVNVALQASRTASKFFLYSGARGVGKSHFISLLTAQIESPNVLLLRGATDGLNWLSLDAAIRGAAKDVELCADFALGGAVVRALPSASRAITAPAAEGDITEQQLVATVVDWLSESIRRATSQFVLIIDDFDLLDKTSREVVLQLASATQRSAVIIALSSKDVEIDGAVRGVILPFNESEIADFLVGKFNQDIDPGTVATFFRMSDGSPGLLSELVYISVDQGLLYPADGRMVVDQQRLATCAMPASVEVATMSRLDQLSVHRDALSVLAVCGSSFAPSLADEVANASATPLQAAIYAAVQAGLMATDAAGSFRFIYAPMVDLLCAELEPKRRDKIHQIIAVSLAKSNVRGDRVLAANHLMAILELESDSTGVESFADGGPFGEFAANCALGAAAALVDIGDFSGAVKFGQFALKNSKQRKHLAESHAVVGKCEASIGRVESALEHLKNALSFADNRDDIFRVKIERVRAFNTNFDNVQALNELLEAFGALGMPVQVSPLGMGKAAAGALATLVLGLLGVGEGGASDDRRLTYRQFIRAAEIGSQIATLSGNVKLMLILGMRALLPAWRIGTSPEAVFSYINFSTILSVMFSNKGGFSFRLHKKAMSVLEKVKDPIATARAQLLAGWAYDFRGDAKTTETLHSSILLHSASLLHAADYWRGCTSLAWNLMMRGHIHNAHQWIERVVQAVAARGAASAKAQGHPYLSYRAALLALLGRAAEAREAIVEAERLALQDPTERYRWGHLLGHQMIYAVETGRPTEELRKTVAAHRARFKPKGLVFHLRHFYVYAAHAYAERALIGEIELAEFKSTLDDLRIAAHVPTTKAHLRLLESIYSWMTNDTIESQRLLDEAAEIALSVDNEWVVFEVAWQRARIARSQSDHRLATAHAVAAEALARSLGFVRRATAIRQQFGLSEPTSAMDSQTASSSTGSAVLALGSKRQIEAICRVSDAASRTLDPREVAAIALDELNAKLGGERAFLFLADANAKLTCWVARANAQEIPAEAYSQSIVDDVFATRESRILSHSDEGKVSASQSVYVHQLRSIIASPLLIADRIQGVIYLDSKVSSGMFSKDDLDVLAPIAGQLTGMIEAAKFAEAEVKRSVLEKDLALSAEVQKLLMPGQSDVRNGSISIAGFSEPSSQCGGDYWWYGFDSRGACTVMLADVSGHGAGPAMITAAIAGMQNALVNTDYSVDAINAHLKVLNSGLCGMARGRYLVAISCLLLEPGGRAHLWSAGGIQLLHAANDTIVIRGEPGANIGGDHFQVGYVDFTVGASDRLLLFTDGVVELERQNGRPFGLRGARQLVASTRPLDPAGARDTVAQTLQRERRGDAFEDDVSFVFVDYVGGV